MNYFFTIVGLVLLADFISGVGHWFEDTYGNPNWKILGDLVIKPNLEHHQTPRSFIYRSYWYRNNTSILSCFVIVLASWVLGFFSWQLLFVFAYLSQVNEIHAIAHRRPDENFVIARFFQKIGLLQSNLHHGWHHKAPYDCNFCILTEYLNPLLNRIRFWQFLENSIKFCFGVSPLRGSAIRNGI
jgi:ubiquitin-conjugating enzyme E2 variant